MKPINKILVSIDFSDYSAHTLNYAVSLANNVGAELILVNVINQRDIAAVERVIAVHGRLTLEGYLTQQKEIRIERADKLLHEAGMDPQAVKKVIRKGIPYIQVNDTIVKEGADLLIMGLKGRTDHPNVRMGSVAEKMFRRCPVPLLSVRGKEGAATRQG